MVGTNYCSKMKCPTTLLLSLLLCLSVSAQKTDGNLKETFLDAEYFLLNEDYSDALFNYIKLYSNGFEENGNINFRIGQCYLNIPSEKEKAIFYLEKAVKYCDSRYQEGVLKETNAPYDAYYYLGTAYRINSQFDKATVCFEKYKDFYKGKDKNRITLADHEIQACANASGQVGKSENILTMKLEDPVSTGNSDIYPVVSGNMNTLVYVSRQKFYDAVFASQMIDGKWSEPRNITSEIQSDGDQYPTFLSYDGSELYLRQEDNFEADLMVSKKNDGVWMRSVNLGKNINSKYWEGNMSMSKDGETIYFSSNRKGSMDIYRSVRQDNGEWGMPENLGPKINTIFNEDAPYITENGNRLYFISQGHQNIGGYDIFYCNISPDGKLSDPVHLGFPVNTADDDLYFYPLKNGAIAYTALNQNQNSGEDLFEIIINPAPELMASLTREKEADTIINQPHADRPSLTLADSGSIAIVKLRDESVRDPDRTLSDAAPAKEASISAGENLTEPTPESTSGSKNESATTSGENTIILPTLFFNFNSFELTENGKKSLDYMVTVYKNFNELKIEFTGHTDALGSKVYNQLLSEKRAIAAKKYLVNKGIPANAIITRGSGENEFITINRNTDGTDNPEGRKFNRRVEIRILEKKPDTRVLQEDLNIPGTLRISKP